TYQNNNVPANNYYNNYYQEFMRTLSQEANNPNSVYYNPGFYEQYNNYNAMQGNPYQDTMNAMNWASQNYNNEPYYNGGYNNYNNQGYNDTVNYTNPYEELMKMLETESQNPNSPYYSPNANQNGYYENYNNYDNTAQNDYYNAYNIPNEYYSGYDNTAQNYNQTNNNNMSDNPYQLAAEALIKAAEELTRKANGMQDSNNAYNPDENANLNNNAPSENTQNAPLYIQNFYTPFKVPQIVLDTAAAKYPNVQILDVEVKEIGTYEVRMANNMRLYIDRNGNFLQEKADY
ncbi:hypothetical protein E6A50_01105, partial [Brachyspira hampsonii]|nr:hypothetical protein [Brachyspira hampsonii]